MKNNYLEFYNFGIDALANQGDEGGSSENLNHPRSPA